jgi:hypothetical protein
VALVERSSLIQRIEDVAEDEVVLRFLRAELGSAKWRPGILNALAFLYVSEKLISAGDLHDVLQNGLRRCVLRAYRGYPNLFLFQGFPANVSWARYRLDKESRGEAIYLNHASWTGIARTRSVSQTAAAIAAGKIPRSHSATGESAKAAAAALEAGQWFEEPILVRDGASGPLVILEGNTRMTAHELAGTPQITAIVGTSPSMGSWVCY